MEVYHSTGQDHYVVSNLGDNAVQVVDRNKELVRKIRWYFGRTGAITFLDFDHIARPLRIHLMLLPRVHIRALPNRKNEYPESHPVAYKSDAYIINTHTY